MEKLLIVTILLIFGGCTSQTLSTPSQNPALNSISKSTAQKEQKGWFQQQLDSWKQKRDIFEKNDTLKTQKTRKKVSASKSKKKKSFTLQHIVNELGHYNQSSKNSSPSHVEQLKKMPVIGE